ncbi:MAG: hypothetical protein UT63_C0008G0031 [Candidatus Gottesmanbacteria bacterium GW2011_GWC2_39_8]|uniref:Cohesin domain-containing protein n=1 Tax=Candidatus Gottesmanbacteria bacterium GW2011_GWC2_39_8 TaxID=1618450 RepID=A0A0G0T805_9BACT|nr:MAG: hypothetical protein UT63_C0008G0031 [Candidatus Gottesmanbacteria bacterium GW2011_GWC2_39_8]
MPGKFKRLPLYLGMLFVVFTIPVVGAKLLEQNSISVLKSRADAPEAVFTMSPDRLTIKKGGMGTINLLINAKSSVAGVDVSLDFDPVKVGVLADSLTMSSVFDKPLVPTLDKAGKFSFSSLTLDSKGVTDGVIGAVKVIGISEGEGFIAFNNNSSKAIDAVNLSNILSQSKGTVITVTK